MVQKMLNVQSKVEDKFDKNNICSACNYHEYKKSINWKKRESEFLKLLDTHRSKK